MKDCIDCIVKIVSSTFLPHSDLFQTKKETDKDKEEEGGGGGGGDGVDGKSSAGNAHYKRALSACWTTTLSLSFLVSQGLTITT